MSWSRIRNFHNADLSSVQQIADEGANALNEIPDNLTNSDDDTSYSPDSENSDDDETLQADSDTDNDDSDDESEASSDPDSDDDSDGPTNPSSDSDDISNSENQGASYDDEISGNEGARDDDGSNENDPDDADKENQDTENTTNKKNITKSKKASKQKTHYDLRQSSAKTKSFRRRFDKIQFQFLQMQRDTELNEFCASTGLKVADFIQAQIMLTQMSAKRGIKLYGDKSISAIVKEFSQLDELDVFEPMYSKQLTKEQMAKALRSITVIKAKRCGRIKGKTVADGRPQRNYVPKEESSSPTVGTESLFLSLVIDAYEGRYIATADIAGAFLHASMDDFVLVKIDGPMVL